MKILAIETSCDETGLALIEASGGPSTSSGRGLRVPKFKVLESLVSSQIPIHRPFGGVVPNLAKREHLKNLPLLYAEMFGDTKSAARLWQKIDFITVTVGPGLEPALWTGIEFAKKLAKEFKKPLVGANHLEGHLYSFLLPDGRQKETPPNLPLKGRRTIFPAVALIVSGGHTILLAMDSFFKWKHLGETRDDAAGEAFDKVARMLELPYPGGPEIEKLAKKGNPQAIAFPRPMLHEKNFDFSFSGLKTAVLYYLRDRRAPPLSKGRSGGVLPASQEKNPLLLPLGKGENNAADVAASFQKAAIDVLVAKTIRAAEMRGAKSVILCGGVAANRALRGALKKASAKIGCQFFVPEFTYNLDNAAMIAAAGYMAHLRKKKYPLCANGNLGI
jgi:N6-L-threonylcarbamoyladenine synthase